MYRIGIYDDDLNYVKKSKKQFNQFFQKKNMEVRIYEFHEEKELIEFYDDGKKYIDFIFMNTMIQNVSTIPLAKQIRILNPASQIVFWTSESDRSRCYEVDHSYFLYKQVLEKNIDHMFKCLFDKYEQIQKDEKNQKLVIHIRGKKVFLMQNRIQYMERNERKTYIYLYNNESEKVIVTAQKMNEREKDLNPQSFIRCHNSYIVNINYIAKLYREHVILKNDKSIPISRKYSKKIRERF